MVKLVIVDVAGPAELVVTAVATVETISVLDAVDSREVGAGLEIAELGIDRDEVVRSDVEMVVGGKGKDEMECTVIDVFGPVELLVLVGADVEDVLLHTVDAGVVKSVVKRVVCLRGEDVMDCKDVVIVVG